jgi:uncharacterized protein YjdB
MPDYYYNATKPWYSLRASITSVVISDGVTSIRDYAFSDCGSLTSVTIGNSVTSIGQYAFYGCNGLKEIINKATTPQAIIPNVFSGVNKNTCTLKVPAASLAAYRAAYLWKEFLNIEAIPVPVTEAILNPAELTLPVGSVEMLAATVLPVDATNQNVTWSSIHPEIASVSSNGTVTGIAPSEDGEVYIIATTEDGNFKDSCRVTVIIQPVSGVTLNKTELSPNVNETETLTATVAPADASNQTVTFSSNAPEVATVDAVTGLVTAIAKGEAVITATTEDGGFTATCAVTVTQPVTGVRLNKTELSLNVNETETLVATVLPANANNQTVAWSSSNSAIATVDATGVVIAVSSGTAVITVTTEDDNFPAECEVTVTKDACISELSLANVSVYPNPADGELIIDNGEATFGASLLTMDNLSVYDTQGRRVGAKNILHIQQNGTITLDISHLSSGVYFLHIEKDRKTQTVKVVKR